MIALAKCFDSIFDYFIEKIDEKTDWKTRGFVRLTVPVNSSVFLARRLDKIELELHPVFNIFINIRIRNCL